MLVYHETRHRPPLHSICHQEDLDWIVPNVHEAMLTPGHMHMQKLRNGGNSVCNNAKLRFNVP